MQELLTGSWQRAWHGVGARGDGHALMQQLLSAYAEPQRHYHTQQHLAECLHLFSEHSDVARHPAEVEMALWFHDAIYDVQAHENEAKSAEWAAFALREAGVASATITRVGELVLATRHRARPETIDAQLLVDIDLSILGAPLERFSEYEVQIRAEYAWVPEAVFRQKRAAILNQFLARQPLYLTRSIREKRERIAKENLAQA